MDWIQLDPRFFIQHPWQPELLKKWAQLGSWNEGFFPIYEWNGILYVAFAGAQPGTVKKVLPVIFLNCPGDILNKVFHHKKLELQEDPFASIEALSSPEAFASEQVFSPTEDLAPEGLFATEEMSQAARSASLELEEQVEETLIQTTPTQNPPARAPKLENILSQLSLVFPKVMILKIEKDRLTPMEWMGSWIPPKSIRSYSLSSASPFRIVARTLKPFHGPVHPSDVGDSFAKDWNAGQIPEHLSIVALMNQEQLVGLLLGLGSGECRTQIALQTTEKLAHKIEALNWFQKSA